ncbi:MAG TPA: hypothetical protein VMM13_03760 [Euzebya sp.]|nr:hypothetical protein [Euzebya sp.]
MLRYLAGLLPSAMLSPWTVPRTEGLVRNADLSTFIQQAGS